MEAAYYSETSASSYKTTNLLRKLAKAITLLTCIQVISDILIGVLAVFLSPLPMAGTYIKLGLRKWKR
jgi:hypothetical protein